MHGLYHVAGPCSKGYYADSLDVVNSSAELDTLAAHGVRASEPLDGGPGDIKPKSRV